MLYQLPKTIQLLFFILFSTFVHAQEGTVTGILNGNDGNPLPGVNVFIKNSRTSTTTNFDGAYEIACKAGDILKFSSIGMKTKEVLVTIDMFQGTSKSTVKMIPVKNIKSAAYLNAIKKNEKITVAIPSIESSEFTYNHDKYRGYYYNYYQHSIKKIAIDTNNVTFTHLNPNVFFEIGYNTNNGFKFIKENNLPELQNTYSQGTSLNGDLIFQGPETGTAFSYGPKILNLEFDGSNYQYDINGKLVPLGNGNGKRAKSYNNTIFDASLKSSHHLFFNINTNNSLLGFDYTYKTEKDLYNIERNNAHLASLKYIKKSNEKIGWDTFIKYTSLINNQTNINGFQNNLLLNSWITPVTFNTNESYILSDETQRSFNPTGYNNPNWLLNNHNNSEKNTEFVASLKNTFPLSDEIKLETKVNYKNAKNTQNFGLPKNTIGFKDGNFSDRNLIKNNFNGSLNFKYNNDTYPNELIVNSNINYNHQDLEYIRNEFNTFGTLTANNLSFHRNKFRLSNNARYISDDIGLILFLGVNSYISSIQNDKWFLPTIQFKLRLHELLDIYPVSKLSIYSSTTLDVNDSKLLYDNQSHNSLQITPNESLQYLATNDLFLDSTLKLEEKQNYEIGLDTEFRVSDVHVTFNATHFNTETKNVVFPILENNEFRLKNVATIKNSGIEAELGIRTNNYRSLNYASTITFSKNRSTVLELTGDTKQIPIAGFSTTSKNLIVGQPAGVIVGSAYERNENNSMLIDENGFPIVAKETKIIGDPTPKFNVGFSNSFRWKDIALNFVIDAQKGGDIWNGTQNVLNYFGTSQQSETEREITNHIFNGVNQLGEENIIPVDFYNSENDISENKFVRNGFEGVAEDAIVDGSYINLKSISLSYKPIKNEKDKFIRDLKISIYGTNLFTWSKFKGASPYSSLYGNIGGTGLNFFNAPLISEVGFKINVKI